MNSLYGIKNFLSGKPDIDWEETIQAMNWIQENLPVDAKIVALTNGTVSEWMPNICQRTVINVWQGTEWDPAKEVMISQLNNDLNNCNDFDCIYLELKPLEYQYLYLIGNKDLLASKQLDAMNHEYEFIWENAQLMIYRLSFKG